MHFKYNKRGIEPKNIESPFNLDELFFSITNPKGIILTGNDVFVHVSKFTKDEMIGKPHNIIRHPDMPRTIFKALWDTIKSGKPFVGYVKNMAKDGSYYWVLAAVYPIFNNEGEIEKYISIRLKPTSEYFKLIPELYREILEKEIKEDMDAAQELLIKKIQELGFHTYEDFAKRIFFEEILNREKLLDQNSNPASCRTNLQNILEENLDFIDSLCGLETIFLRINRYFNEIFNKVHTFLDLNEELEKKSNFIFGLAEDIRLLSLNASIESYKVKKEGVSFSTLSHEMRKNAEISERKVLEMNRLINEAKKDIEGIGFNILTLKLNIEMIVFFIKEMIVNFSDKEIGEKEENEITNNINELFQLMQLYVTELQKSMFASKNMLRSILYNISELNILINRLDFIHINGMIESAHTEEEEGGFHIIFSQMLHLIERAKQEIINLEHSLFDATEENTTVFTITNIAIQKINQAKKRFSHLLVG
ncbi:MULTISPECIES: PAS domain-containing protein [unclassified Nitratiruptor]|uniref:PAS domain-containing protein n=1 Tax=unclassified Nitratiruptor TaxID=2624044 RepID=UPI001915F030|nr:MULTISPECIES: PAS domain-containing protein [unclassified Nitratiruptor]BCD59899.1 aerotaxis receptor [Nitratiruptor sp. YY08-10]BCD63822.1 aerotaxis receptor [Nitratiruptor sp. YY08-14]